MMPVVGADPSKRLAPDELGEPVAPLPASFAARPQGGGTAPCDERAVFTAVVYALTSGCAWRHLGRRSARGGVTPEPQRFDGRLDSRAGLLADVGVVVMALETVW